MKRICLITLPETNIAPKNGWLEFGILLSYWAKRPIFRGYVPCC